MTILTFSFFPLSVVGNDCSWHMDRLFIQIINGYQIPPKKVFLFFFMLTTNFKFKDLQWMPNRGKAIKRLEEIKPINILLYCYFVLWFKLTCQLRALTQGVNMSWLVYRKHWNKHHVQPLIVSHVCLMIISWKFMCVGLLSLMSNIRIYRYWIKNCYYFKISS